MTNVYPKVDAIAMGGTYAPLNTTVNNLSLSTSNSGTSWRHTLTVAAAQTITLDTGCSTIHFIPSDIPAGAIFIKFGTADAQTDASASNFDVVLTPADPCVQLWVRFNVTRYSIYSATSQTVYTIERP